MTNEFDCKGCKFDYIISKSSMCRNCKRRISKECMADWYEPIEPEKVMPELPSPLGNISGETAILLSLMRKKIDGIIDYLKAKEDEK